MTRALRDVLDRESQGNCTSGKNEARQRRGWPCARGVVDRTDRGGVGVPTEGVLGGDWWDRFRRKVSVAKNSLVRSFVNSVRLLWNK